MRLEDCKIVINNYLNGDDNRPRIVNVNNVKDLIELKDYFDIGNNKFLTVGMFSKKDENISVESLLNSLYNEKNNVFITEVTTHLKLMGETEVESFINILLHSSFNKKVVLICYQCEIYLNKTDIRTNALIYKVDGELSPLPHLNFINNEQLKLKDNTVVKGVNNLAYVLEKEETNEIYVDTSKTKRNYPESLYVIREENDPYAALCFKDTIFEELDKSFGTIEEWERLLKEFLSYKSFDLYITDNFGSCKGLEFMIPSWNMWSEYKKWIFFLALKLYGAPNNSYLQEAIKVAPNKNKLIETIYRNILNYNIDDENFREQYNLRKELLKTLGDNVKETMDYCRVAKIKDKDAIYYLTDNSVQEKELILYYLDKYGNDDNYEEIIDILKIVYPQLYAYLCPYTFNDEMLENYFQTYKYQKVVNKIFDDFKNLVIEQMEKRDFNSLPPRTSKTEEIEKKNTALYFIDAMGVEFLSYILYECQRNDLIASTTVCRCELPSLTEYNKEFIDVFSKGGAELIGGEKGIKRLDELKHSGVNSYDYEKSRLPLHLIGELKIFKEIIEEISAKLISGDFERAVLISDHGASRLAVINENENKWEMATKGEHSGRCCPVNEIDEKPGFATEENGFWVLANYDRFKGGRKSDIEVHGGATLEEVVVPIIEITRKSQEIEITMETKEIKFNVREKNAEIRIFSTTKIHDVTVEVDGNRYKPITENQQKFIVKLPDLKDEKVYSVKVYSKNNLLTDKLTFKAEKEGMKKRKYF